MKNAVLGLMALHLVLMPTGWAAECPWEKPYKCQVTGYSQYRCGCGVEWTQARSSSVSNSFNPWLNTPQITVNVAQPYAPPRYITYGSNIYLPSHKR